MNDQLKKEELLFKVIALIKEAKKNEGTQDAMLPSEILNKIIGISTDLPDVRDFALKESYGED